MSLRCFFICVIFRPMEIEEEKSNYLHRRKADSLFPKIIGADNSAHLFEYGLETLRSISHNSSLPWVPYSLSDLSAETLRALEENYGSLPDEGVEPQRVIRDLVQKFFPGVPHWRSPELQYNICAPVNAAAAALTGLAQEINIHNISTDFAGRCLSAENAVSRIMATLIDLQPENVRGLFTFGGTGTNMYAMKLAINKAVPMAGKSGIPGNLYFLMTADAHFSHKTIADWLGIGVDRALQIKADTEGRSIVEDAETKARNVLGQGGILAGFMLNGGPFYNFAIDDIQAFVHLREKLVADYKLVYTPHIHVDSVIGWIWLMFNGYNFESNPLEIPREVLPLIEEQSRRAYGIRLADSWGADFHKAFGGCPAPCGFFVSNHRQELLFLSKSKRGIDTHHLGNDWSTEDPSDITLETSRAAGVALAALGSLITMGRNGFRRFLANQMAVTKRFRDMISETRQFIVGNPNALGFNTMVLAFPPGFPDELRNLKKFLEAIEQDKELLSRFNQKLRDFYEWCLRGPNPNIGRLGCSFSRSFKRTLNGEPISGLKYCFVSPHMDYTTVEKEVSKLQKQLDEFYHHSPDQILN